MKRSIFLMLFALMAMVLPPLTASAQEKSITLTKDDFTNLDGSPWTTKNGSSNQVIAVKDGITFHCFLRKEPSGEVCFNPDDSFISVKENPNNLAFTKVALSFPDITPLSSKLYLYKITGTPNYGTQYNTFGVLLNREFLTKSSIYADFASVNNGGTVVDFSSSPTDKFFIARDEKDPSNGYNDYTLESVTFYYTEGEITLNPEISFNTPPTQLSTNESATFEVELKNSESTLDTPTITTTDGDLSGASVTLTSGNQYTFIATKPGTYTVTFSAQDNSVSNSFEVVVTKTEVKIEITGAPSEMHTGEAKNFTVNVTPEGLDYEISVTDIYGNPVSASDIIVTKEEDQVTVEAKAEGEFRISISVVDGEETISQNVDIKVTEASDNLEFKTGYPQVAVTSLTIDLVEDGRYGKIVNFNTTFSSTPSYEISPDNGGIEFSPNTARGTILPIKVGTYQLHVWGNNTNKEAYTGTLTVIVIDSSAPADDDISFSDASGLTNSLTVKVGSTADFKVNPDTGIENLDWTKDPAYTISGTYPDYTIQGNTSGEYNIIFTGKVGGVEKTATLQVNITSDEDTLKFSDWSSTVFTTTTMELGSNGQDTKTVYLNPYNDSYNVEITPNNGGLDFSHRINWVLTATKPGTYTVKVYGISKEGKEVEGTMTVIVTGEAKMGEVEFSGVPASMEIPADQNFVSVDFSASPVASDYTITITKNNVASTGLTCTDNGDGNYTLSATEEGTYTVFFSNDDNEGFFNVTVIKSETPVVPTAITFSDGTETITSLDLKVDDVKSFSILPISGLENVTWTENEAYTITGYYPNFSITANNVTEQPLTVSFSGTYSGETLSGSFTLSVAEKPAIQYEELQFEINDEVVSSITIETTGTKFVYLKPYGNRTNVVLPEIDGLNIGKYNDGYYGYFELSGRVPGTYYIEVTSVNSSGKPEKGILEVIVKGDKQPVTFTVSPEGTIVIPEGTDPTTVASAVITPEPWQDDYVVTCVNKAGQEVSAPYVNIIKNSEAENYTLTTPQPGSYTITFSNSSYEGSVTLNVKKRMLMEDKTITIEDGEDSATYDLEVPAQLGAVETWSVTPNNGGLTIAKSETGDNTYTLTASTKGTYTVEAETELFIGSVTVTVNKNDLEGITFTGNLESLEIQANATSGSFTFTVDPAAPESDPYNIQVTSGATVEPTGNAGEYTFTAYTAGTYTVNFRNSTHKGTFTVNVTKANDKTVINFFKDMFYNNQLTSISIDVDKYYKPGDSSVRPYSCYIWPNIKNDEAQPKPTFNATVRTLDGEIVYSTAILKSIEDDTEKEVYEHNAPVVVKHGGNDILITPHAPGEYIVRLEGVYYLNDKEECAGEIRLTVTGIELTVGVLPSVIYEKDTIELSITPEDADLQVTAKDPSVVEIIESNGKYSFKALKPGKTTISVTRSVTDEEGEVTTKTVEVSVTITEIPTIDVFISNPHTQQGKTDLYYEVSEEPYLLHTNVAAKDNFTFVITPNGDAPADGIVIIPNGEEGDDYYLYANTPGKYHLLITGTTYDSEGHECLVSHFNGNGKDIVVGIDTDTYDLQITDPDGNPLAESISMDKTLWFLPDIKSESENGYTITYNPPSGHTLYDSTTGAYKLDAMAEDLYTVILSGMGEDGVVHKGKFSIEVTKSEHEILNFEETIPAQIRLGKTLVLHIDPEQITQLTSDMGTYSVTPKDGGITVTPDMNEGLPSGFTITGNKVGEYRITLSVKNTIGGSTRSKTFRLKVISDETIELEFQGLPSKFDPYTYQTFKVLPVVADPESSLNPTISGELTFVIDPAEGLTIEKELYSNEYIASATMPGEYDITVTGKMSTNQDAEGSVSVKVNKLVATYQNTYVDHIRNNGYDSAKGHAMSTYIIENDINEQGKKTMVSSAEHLRGDIVITPVLDKEWAAKYQWDDNKHGADDESHAYYHGLWIGKPEATITEDGDFQFNANIPGVYNVTIRTIRGLYTEDSRSFRVIVDPNISAKDIDIWHDYMYYDADNQTLYYDPDNADLSKVQIFTGFWGPTYHKVEEKSSNSPIVMFAASEIAEREDHTDEWDMINGRQMDLSNASSVKVQQKVNGQITPVIEFAVTPDASKIPTGVAGVNADMTERYFTLDGMEIPKPSQQGVYVKVVNGRSTKIIIR